MGMLSLGIVGCGRVTRLFHIKAVEELPEVEVVAVSDVNLDSMNQVQKACNIPKTYDTYSMLLDDESIDAVAINTPPRFHEEMVLMALDAAKHVLCEKPLSTNVEGCRRIGEKVLETGLTVLPAHNYSFTPGLQMMERLIEEGKIGKILSMKIAFLNNLKQYRPDTDFRTLNHNGLIEDVLPHVLSVVHPILGYCTGVQDVNWLCKTYEVCDNMDVTLNTEKGVDVSCSMSWTKLVPTFEVEVTGSDGSLSGEFGLKPFTVELQRDREKEVLREKGIRWYLDLLQFKHPSFQNQYTHFYELVKGKVEPRITLDDEINIIEAVENLSGYIE